MPSLVAGGRPDWQWYQLASEQVAADELDAAEETIEGALVAGHLWRVSLLTAPTLQALRGRDRFEALASEARQRVDRRHLEPLVITAAPRIQAHVAPLLLILHGATGNASAELERWHPATDLGWIVAAGQSSQPATSDGFCWDPPRERVAQDLRVIAAQLPPHGRVVVAGFSQGAWIALNLALQADIVVAGSVVMIAPFAGPDANLPSAWRRLRVSILIGENDTYRTPVELLARQLTQRDHHVALEVIPDLGHAYPADFVARLPNLLSRS
jgi:pimeloyl-ACP methyl ester carboxylesterase